MSGSVTPARRPREDDDSDIEDFEPSIDGAESPRSSARKRARIDDGEHDEDNGAGEDSDAEHGSLLPDSFRRSPKSTGRGVDMLADRQTPQEHKPGSIVRVTLTNFVTYTKAEFNPGPNLNMIIGPNGTGKSTLVCAICLGTASPTSILGRAKDVGEFVKHGSKKALIEIELAKDPDLHDENPVITTKITKEGNKVDFSINSRKSTQKAVKELCKAFSIQVDNLCQFLPQDRVVEFAGLSPEALLGETQRAAAPPEMTEWHEQLKAMRKEQKGQQAEQQKLLESLKQDQGRQRLQEADVVRLREHSELQEREATLKKLRPFPKYALVVEQYQEAKARKEEAKDDLKGLKRRLQPNLRAVQAKEHYCERIGKVVNSCLRLVQRHDDQVVANNKAKIDAVTKAIEKCEADIAAEKNSNKTTAQSMITMNREITRLKAAIDNPPEPCDFAAINEQNRDIARRLREVEDGLKEIAEQKHGLQVQGTQRKTIIDDCQKDKENLRSQAGKQLNKLKRLATDTADAWEWIKNNRHKFQGEVYGPPVIECSLKDPRTAAAVESVLHDSEKLAFTVTNQADFGMLNRQLYTNMRLQSINIRSSLHPLSAYVPPMRTEDLQRSGLDCWLLHLIEGPEAVLAMLCDNGSIHRTAFTDRDISDAQFESLRRTSLQSWVTKSNTFRINRRREYGDQATSTQMSALKQARFFTDAPVDLQQEDELNAKQRVAEGELTDIAHENKALNEKAKGLVKNKQVLEEEQRALAKTKNEKQRQQVEYKGLEAKLQGAEEKLRNAQDRVDGSHERRRVHAEKADGLIVSKGQMVLDYANSVEALRGLHIQLYEAEVLHIEARSDLEQTRAQHAEEERQLEERTRQVQQLTQDSSALFQEGLRLGDACRQANDDLSEAEKEVWKQVIDEAKWTSDQLEIEIESVAARIQLTAGNGKQGIIKDFEARAARMEEKQERLRAIEGHLHDLFKEIEELQQKWEPKLDELVSKISDAFAENFARIQSAGEVAVYKDDESFEQWAIQIKVKFRENEQLSILDSHRQSGGERAVSTIFYLMALQSLARAPFRVVDEINQGMDPRNERLVHSRMVEIACAEHTSQYFLITPKLLNGLTYHKNMKVHCIASGEYMPDDHRDLDFGALAKKALAIRG